MLCQHAQTPCLQAHTRHTCTDTEFSKKKINKDTNNTRKKKKRVLEDKNKIMNKKGRTKDKRNEEDQE